jgi:hypothetical protein
MTRQRLAFVSLAASVTLSGSAQAYRPFDGTDADVAAPREIELELGPAGYLREGTEGRLVLPALVFNYGVVPGSEVVLEGRDSWLLRRRPQHNGVDDVALSLKSVLRSGSLQGRRGLSVALESGLLLAGSHEPPGVHVASIISQRWSELSLHLNLSNDLLAAPYYQAGAGLIIEGPDAWRVRPVAEILLGHDFGSASLRSGFAESVLVGAIAPYSEAFAFDLGLRYGHTDRQRDEEARLGLTWSFGTR